jgi:DNA-3-methyladenine glycosylase
MTMLDRNFFARPTLEVAEELVGCHLVYEHPDGVRGGRIVETEAYIGTEDLACHARSGKTKRNAPMFGPAGHAYIYLIYGIHHCLNIVTEQDGFPAAVLIRALERDKGVGRCHGPGRLTRALGLDLSENDLDMTAPPLYVEPREGEVTVEATTRIGVDYAGNWARKPWRFLDPASEHLSAPIKAR